MIHNQIQHKAKNQNQNQQDSDKVTHFELEYMKKEVKLDFCSFYLVGK